MTAAEQLVGQFANLKPHDHDMFLASVAGVLQTYPWGLVRECVDPRYGVARKTAFLSIKEMVDWLDVRQDFYRSLAAYRGRATVPQLPAPEDPVQAGVIAGMIRKLVGLMRSDSAPSPLDRLHAGRRDSLAMTRKSILARGGDDAP